MKHIIISLCILLIVVCVLKYTEKFKTELKSPKILKIYKQDDTVTIEWYNDNSKITNFVLLYVDVERLSDGIWIKTDIKCKTKRCKITINNLVGKKYKLAILSKIDDNLSTLKKEDIATFSDEEDYNGIAFENTPAVSADFDNTEIKLDNNDNKDKVDLNSTNITNSNKKELNLENNNIKKNDGENNNEEIINEKKNNKDNKAPSTSPSPSPTIDCTGGLVRTKNIKTKEDLENAELKTKCDKMENLSGFVKSPFYHYYWDRFF